MKTGTYSINHCLRLVPLYLRCVLREEIQKLPPAQRAVVNMFVIDELGHKEISKILGIHEGTSKSNLYKAKNNLKEELKKYVNV